MEYTIKKLANLAGVTTRTLRYYDEIGLLKPLKINESGYRIYGQNEVDALQQILFFRELGFDLSGTERVLKAPTFERLATLKNHLTSLEIRRQQLNLLIENVQKTILKEEGVITMTDDEKFKGFKKQAIEENEKLYGTEIREKYGDEQIDKSNAKLLNLSKEEYDRMQELGEKIFSKLEEAVINHADPNGELGLEIAQMHKKWLSYTWPSYTSAAHIGLVDMYLADNRFTAYYDKNMQGCAKFLNEAVRAMVNQ